MPGYLLPAIYLLKEGEYEYWEGGVADVVQGEADAVEQGLGGEGVEEGVVQLTRETSNILQRRTAYITASDIRKHAFDVLIN